MQPPWNRYDAGYLALGVAFMALAALLRGPDTLILGPCVILAYCAGRFAGAQH